MQVYELRILHTRLRYTQPLHIGRSSVTHSTVMHAPVEVERKTDDKTKAATLLSNASRSPSFIEC